MSAHLCQQLDVNKEMLKQLVAGRNRRMDPYKCGSCLKTFETICVLHLHCMKHNEGGSYYFDHVTNTAYPKYDTKCSYAQVNFENTDDYDSYERILIAFSRSIDRKQHSDKILDVEEHKLDQEGVDERLVAERIDIAESTVKTKDRDRSMTAVDHGVTAVNVRNIARSADGITFEMDEKHAHLFNATAGVIMDRISTSGDGWLQLASELQVMVPNDGGKDIKETPSAGAAYINTATPFVSTEPVDEPHISATFNTLKDLASQELFETTGEDYENSNKITENIHVDTARKVSVKEHGSEVQEHDQVNMEVDSQSAGATILSVDEIVTPADRESTQETDVMENLGKVAEADLQNTGSTLDKETVSSMNVRARPVRHRKPSSRLSASEWETPGRKRSENNDNSSDRGKSVRPKVTEKALSDSSSVFKAGEFHNQIKPDGTEFPELSTVITTSDDISASRVLLSLSKGLSKNLKPVDETGKNNTRKQRKRKSHTATSNTKLDNIKQDSTEVKDVDLEINTNIDAEVKKEIDISIEHTVHKRKRRGACDQTCVKDNDDVKLKRASKRVSARNSNTGAIKDEDDAPELGRLSERSAEAVSGEKRRDYVCRTCGKTGTKEMLDYHKLAHGAEAAFKCEVCGKRFKTRQCFSAHKRLHGERKFKCDQCSAAFFRKQYLDTHVRSKHTGEVPYVCDHCGAGFMESYILQRHIKNKHRQERNHTCEVCGMTFFRADTRDTHRERHFEATLKCAYCDKHFKAELDRRKHELTHTGEKQVFCPLCHYGFAQVWSYYRHMWKKHNITKEEAKVSKIKNPDLVYMRNKLLDYKADDKKERTNKAPIYSVNKRVAKPAAGTERDAEHSEVKYQVELPAMEESNQGTLDVERERTVEEQREGTQFDLIAAGGGQLVAQSEFGDPEREMYGELATHPQHMFVNSSNLPDGMVLQDGHAMEGRSALVLGDGQSVEGTNISIVLDDGQTPGQRNLVILSADIEAYAKQYSAVDL